MQCFWKSTNIAGALIMQAGLHRARNARLSSYNQVSSVTKLDKIGKNRCAQECNNRNNIDQHPAIWIVGLVL